MGKKNLDEFNIQEFYPTKFDDSNKKEAIIPESELSRQIEETDISENFEENIETPDSIPTKSVKKTMTNKQRKTSLREYQETFLGVPKITDRKTVFISNELRQRIVEVILRLGSEKSSVSGFIENLVKHHLDIYNEDVEAWKKL